MAESKFFQFKSVAGYAPAYRFNGGTKAISEMTNLSIEDMLKYVHKYASVSIDKNKECLKNKEKAMKILEKSSKVKGINALTDLNKALVLLPEEDSEISKKIRDRIDKLSSAFKTNSEVADSASIEEQASDKLKIEYKKGVGRHVIAAKDIAVGEVIIREKPFVSFLHSTNQLTNCLYCMKAVVSGTGCGKCSQVIFCSKRCCESSKDFHGVECGFMNMIPGLGPLAPVLRIFTSKSVQYFLDRIDMFKTYDKSSGDLSRCDGGFENLFNLQAGNKTTSQYKIDKAAYAYYLVCLLKKMSYFENNKDESFEMEHVVVGMFIDHFLKIADDNCHEVCELDLPKSVTSKTFDELFESEDSAIKVVGVAIYPKISLFNNSCDVNTLKYHETHHEVIVARRDIKKGEEVNDFYGEYFFQSGKLSRKKNLGFPCGCIPCKENWPLLDDLPNFTFEEVEARYDWAVERVALESALTHMDVPCIKKICEHLGQIVNVKGPHQVKVQPELYLYYSYLFLFCNKSVKFQQLYNKVMQQAGKTEQLNC